MATIDIGKIKPVFRGTYDNSTAYVLDDIVYYNGSSYVAKTSTTGNLPTDATKWNVLASGSGGIWDSTLGIGSAGQIVKVNSGGNALEFGTVAGGAFGQMVYNEDTTTYSNTSQSNFVRATNTKVDITPSASGKEILVIFNLAIHFTYTDSGFEHRIIRSVGGTETILRTSSNIYEYAHLGGQSNWNRYSQSTVAIKDAPNTASQVTYTIEFRNPHRTAQMDLNEAGGELSQIIALEIN